MSSPSTTRSNIWRPLTPSLPIWFDCAFSPV
jgi:hypothetical protein